MSLRHVLLLGGRRHAAPFARRPAHRMRAGRRLTDEYRARGPL
ncbi:hypothetical protein MYA_5189 [Burkholderia sp. KJ006]|nr:hypothetical protein MYA_5189 [Burkholderia sp. KJ006]